MIVSRTQLELMFVEWKAKVKQDPDEALDAADDYYWRGAYSFKDFLLEKFVVMGVDAKSSTT